MAPVVTSLISVLAVLGSIEAKPLTPGRHANPYVANVLSSGKRSLHSLLARYYGTAHGLSKPPALPEKRSTNLPSGWSYLYCASESWEQRLLQGFSFSSSKMTPLLCTNECQTLGFTIAGTEFGDECYCGNAFVGSGGNKGAASKCNVACQGDSSAECGAGWWLSVYTYNATTSSCETTSPATTAATSVVANATVPVPTAAVASVNGTAATASIATGTAAVTGTATTSASLSAATATYVDATDASEWYSLGCALDSDARILDGYVGVGITDLTIDDCLTMCEDKGYAFAGMEWGEECYCGHTVPTTITYDDSNCNMTCTGNSGEICGGNWGLDLFELISSANATECNTTPATTSSSSVAAEVDLATKVTTAAATTAAVTQAATTKAASATTAASATGSAVAADSTTVASSSSTHNVWAHHMVGNTYPYGQSDWLSDINAAHSYGIDGFALNIGSDSWQSDRVNDAYSAASSSGTGFKLFLSLDMTSLGCASSSDAANLVNLVKAHATHSNQAMHNGKVLVSTFAGSDCMFGTGSNNAWQSSFVDALSSDGVDIFFVPSLFSDTSTFSSNTWMDGELNWNSGWPMDGSDISTSSDSTYMSALGSKEYMPAISPFFFTHFPVNGWNKNWIYRSDDWLYCNRWEQIIAMRDSVKMTEILTWNDYGESSYIGPIAGALPAGSEVWVDGFEHDGINVLTKYYSTAFKTGSYPTITEDTILMWQRPHSKDASASDPIGKPTRWDATEDNLYAVVLTTGPAIVEITSGGTSSTFSVSGGLTKLKVSSKVGQMSGSIVRDGSTVASYNSGSSFSYTNSPSSYNFNYMIGSSS
ncbi:glucan endo-1,3-alpha-glucosidase, partial [Tremellales sp. Uapishka_1]